MVEKYIEMLDTIQTESEGNSHYKIIKEMLQELITPVATPVEIQIKPKILNGSNYGPNIGILKDDKFLLILEYKKEGNREFNIDLNNLNSDKCLKSKGELPKFKKFISRFSRNKEANEVEFPNNRGDGIGQIRGYYYTSMYFDKLHPNAFAILTNGKYWIIFELRKSNNKDTIEKIALNGLNRTECIHLEEKNLNANENVDKVYYCQLPEDEEILAKYLRTKLKIM